MHFRDDKVSIAKIRLVPITVSQLKCALHILIGDWYDKWALPTQTEPLIQQDMSPPYRGCFVYRGAFFACELRDPNGVVAAQPFAPEERYGCGVPLAGACPTNFDRTLAVGRDDSARRCRNYRLRTNSPPMSLRGAQRRGCAAVHKERVLRMRYTPCGCNLVQAPQKTAAPL